MSQVCSQHRNEPERVCLAADCESRLMCLLCEHDHGQVFQSIRIKKSQSLKRFTSIVESSIDEYLVDQNSGISKIQNEQHVRQISSYYNEVRARLLKFIEQRQMNTVRHLGNDHNSVAGGIKTVRVNRDYFNCEKRIQDLLFKAYDGLSIKAQLQREDDQRVQNAKAQIDKLQKHLEYFWQAYSFASNFRVPDFRVVGGKYEVKMDLGSERYEIPTVSNHQVKTNLRRNSAHEFSSIISDCVGWSGRFIVGSYDNALRIFDSSLQLVRECQQPNIVNKLHMISQDVVAVGVSKQLHIYQLTAATNQADKLLTLRSQSQRINDIDHFNTRVVGSSSSEGVKVWDLYRERVQHTFREPVAAPTTCQFLPAVNMLAIGYSDHLVRIYSIETLKTVNTYRLPGLPLTIRRECLGDNCFYAGGFPSNLCIIDIRAPKLAMNKTLLDDAVTCFSEIATSQGDLLVGLRNGRALVLNTKKTVIRHAWQAHSGMSTLSKPNGVVSIFQDQLGDFVTVGSNDRQIKQWEAEML